MVRRGSGKPPLQSVDSDLARGLEAMTAPELRAFVHAMLDEFEDEKRVRVIDSLMASAARGDAGWKPRPPSSRIVNDAKSFADAARQVGYADPGDVSKHLRLASRAFLAGDHAGARGVFEAVLLPIATVEIDLGQHELVDDVLNVDVHACIAQMDDRAATNLLASSRVQRGAAPCDRESRSVRNRVTRRSPSRCTARARV